MNAHGMIFFSIQFQDIKKNGLMCFTNYIPHTKMQLRQVKCEPAALRMQEQQSSKLT